MRGPAVQPLLIYGAAGTLTVDLEETCRRLGQPVAALVLNRDLPARVLAPGLLRAAGALSAELLALPFLCPLFTPANRRAAVEEAMRRGLVPAPALVDPTATVPPSTALGPGCYVNAGCILGAAGQVGRFVTLNRGASLGHHAEVGDFASIGPGAVIAGEVTIGAGAMVGAGAVVGPGVRLGEGSVVAAGAAVLRDVPAGALAIGNPARIARRAVPKVLA